MIQEFNKIKSVSGTLNLPGDKSISHRAVMFSSLANGRSEIYNCLMSEDVISTINAL
jgi:3-phosphoshikimate 1-carboxyvinyltransferase